MPLLIAFPERDGSGEIHHHGVLAIDPSLEPKLRTFMPITAWKRLHDQIASSHMTAIYDLHGWLAYNTPSALALEWQVWHGPKQRRELKPARVASTEGGAR